MSNRSDIFLSHNSADKAIVSEIAARLTAKGVKVWLDKWKLIPGSIWQKSIEKAISQTSSVAILIGKAGVRRWAEAEMLVSISLSIEKDIPVIPVLLPNAPAEIHLPLFLRNFGWVDLRSGVNDEGIDQLISGITGQPILEPADSGPQRAQGNLQGAATGNLVTRRTDVSSIHKVTGRKVILYDTNPMTIPGSIRPEDIGAIITPVPLPDNNHFMMWAAENRVPVISGFTLSNDEYLRQSRITADSDTGLVHKRMTFSSEFIMEAQREYEKSVARFAAAGTATPAPLLELFATQEWRPPRQRDFRAWARTWGRVECVARVALFLIAKDDFNYAHNICASLCAEYQWPVGCDNARRVLPQLAYWHPDETVQLIRKWVNSRNLKLVKSACMAVSTMAILSWETAVEILELAISHKELTISKEAARAIPVITSLDPEYGQRLIARCLRIPSLAPIASAYISRAGDPLLGLTLSSIPALLIKSREETFETIQDTTNLIKTHGLGESTLNIARNSIFGNLIILYEADRERTLSIVDALRDFCRDDHIQFDVILAWAWLSQTNPADAGLIFSAIDDKLRPEPHKLYRELLGWALSGA